VLILHQLKKGATCVESLTGAAKLGEMVFLFHRRQQVWLAEISSADGGAISRPRLDSQPACEQELLPIMRTCAEPGRCVPCSPHRPQAHAYIYIYKG
jgi:hypothetical protein